MRITIHRRIFVYASVAACVVMAGCAGGRRTVVVWEKPGASAEELEQARRVCLEQPVPEYTTSQRRDRVDSDTMGRVFVECMEARGWTWKTRNLDE